MGIYSGRLLGKENESFKFPHGGKAAHFHIHLADAQLLSFVLDFDESYMVSKFQLPMTRLFNF